MRFIPTSLRTPPEVVRRSSVTALRAPRAQAVLSQAGGTVLVRARRAACCPSPGNCCLSVSHAAVAPSSRTARPHARPLLALAGVPPGGGATGTLPRDGAHGGNAPHPPSAVWLGRPWPPAQHGKGRTAGTHRTTWPTPPPKAPPTDAPIAVATPPPPAAAATAPSAVSPSRAGCAARTAASRAAA